MEKILKTGCDLMWESIKYIGSSLTLVAFIIACIVWILRYKINEKKLLIEKAHENDRAKLIEKTLEFFSVKVDSLSEEHRYKIVMVQIKERSKKHFRIIVTCIVIFIIMSIIVLYTINKTSDNQKNEKIENIPKLVENKKQSVKIQDSNYNFENLAINMNISSNGFHDNDIKYSDKTIADGDLTTYWEGKSDVGISNLLLSFKKEIEANNIVFRLNPNWDIKRTQKISIIAIKNDYSKFIISDQEDFVFDSNNYIPNMVEKNFPKIKIIEISLVFYDNNVAKTGQLAEIGLYNK
jgi:hypothetical protein